MMPEKIYIKPSTVKEAINAAHEQCEDFCYVAGGTDVFVNKFQGNNNSTGFIDLSGIAELKTVSIEGESIKVGSLVRLDELKSHSLLVRHFPALIMAAREVASPTLRKSATIGGNILCENRCSFYNQSEWWREAAGYCLKCNGDVCIATGGRKACFSKFVSDTAPVLISAGAKLELCDIDGTTFADLESIYTGDGVNPRNLPETTVVKNIILPLNHKYRIVFKKLRPREAIDFTSLTVAVSLTEMGDIRIVVGGVDPKPVVVDGQVNGNLEDYIKAAMSKARVIDNDYYSRKYRREMMRLFLRQSFEELLNN
jgi:4-hydroxybenzoyl-CoA reductase subunit beta